MAINKITRRAYRVDFYHNNVDHECALYGAFGYSSKYITKKTGLSQGQIGYRLRMAGIVRADIRNGASPFSQTLFKHARNEMDDRLIRHLNSHL